MENLCKCNNCETVLFDENPQVGAKKHDTSNRVDVKSMKYVQTEEESFWACPNCETDEYLTDL
jgi:Zn finger protein HypA/HybF involved in hydrogenase expression